MISGVAGLNDNPALGPAFMGTCTTCHNTPNVGDHSVPLAINIGVTDSPAVAPLDTSGLPVYVLRCNATGQTYTVTDPGRALITGKCADIGKTKGPILRGLSARAPYFHNGAAATLRDAVDFYDNRFNLGLSEQDRQDLVAFLQTL
jgi:cytochrome c peroxidase